jgi:uncharacterized membrane protein
MLTPLIIVAILSGPWLLAHLLQWRGLSLLKPDEAGRAGLVLAFLFFALGHFVQTEEMMRLIPAFVPLRRELVWLTGLAEIVIALGLAVRATRKLAAGAALAVLVLFFPANVYGALTAAEYGGHAMGPVYLLVRLPLQLFLLGWAWHFGWRKA